jgi:HSP20 family protein
VTESSLLRDLFSMQEKMDRALTESENALREPAEEDASAEWSPAVDAFETSDTFVLHADLPGVAKDDFTVSIVDRFLTLSGERKRPPDSTGATRHVAERGFGTFKRAFRLPPGASSDRISAHFTNGVLVVLVPKSPIDDHRHISVHSDE